MAVSHKDRVKVAVTTGGSGNLVVGAAVSAHQAFAAGDDGKLFPYVIEDGTAWETGYGTYTHSGTVFARTTRKASSTGSALTVSTSAFVSVSWIADLAANLLAETDSGYVDITSDGSATQSINSATFTKLTTPLVTVNYNEKTWWNTTSKLFSPNRAGKYLIMGGAHLDQLSDTKNFIFSLYKNGAMYRRTARFAMGAADSVAGSGAAIVHMDGATDYIEVYVYHENGSARSTTVGIGLQWFQARYLGP